MVGSCREGYIFYDVATENAVCGSKGKVNVIRFSGIALVVMRWLAFIAVFLESGVMPG